MKKRSKINLLFSVLLIVLLFSISVDNVVFAVQNEDETWSFDFKNCSYSAALNQLSKATGISIFTNGHTDKTPFSKSFRDQTINQILEGLFRRKSHAIMWRYNNGGLEEICIWVFEKGDSRTGFDPSIFKKYKAPDVKINTTKKNQVTAVDRTRSKIETSRKRYASFDVTPKNSERQSDRIVRAQGTKFIGSRSRRTSGNFEENISNQGDYQGTIEPDNAANDVDPDDTNLGPPAPSPEIAHGLEPPPMPPGFSYN